MARISRTLTLINELSVPLILVVPGVRGILRWISLLWNGVRPGGKFRVPCVTTGYRLRSIHVIAH